MTDEWWPELGPQWQPTTAQKPPGRTIDVHTHLMVDASAEVANPHFKPEMDPRTFFSPEVTRRYNKEFRSQPHIAAKFREPAARIEDMDKQGIDMQVVAIAPPQYYYWLDSEVAPRAIHLQHERFAEVVRDHPDRFVAVANLPMDHPELAVEVMREAKENYGFHGFELNGDVNGADYDERRFDIVWEAAEELEMTAILHPMGFTHGQRMDDYYLINVICMPLASTVAVSRMILGGVWERFPDFKMVVVHGGGYLPFYFARTDHAFGVRPELRHHIDRLPSEYLHKLHFDTAVFKPDMVRYLIDEFGADKVLMGTDYPFDMGPTDPLGFLADVPMTEHERSLVLGANAARLFKIDG
jgi:aminocarboxymuconate-semialdehyde decarboxylase